MQCSQSDGQTLIEIEGKNRQMRIAKKETASCEAQSPKFLIINKSEVSICSFVM